MIRTVDLSGFLNISVETLGNVTQTMMAPSTISVAWMAALLVPLLVYVFNKHGGFFLSMAVAAFSVGMIIYSYQQTSGRVEEEEYYFLPWTLSFVLVIHGLFLLARRVGVNQGLCGIGMILIGLGVMKQADRARLTQLIEEVKNPKSRKAVKSKSDAPNRQNEIDSDNPQDGARR